MTKGSSELNAESRKQNEVNNFWSRLRAFSFMLLALGFSCSSTTKEESESGEQGAWTVTVSGKVGFPQQGQITIQEIKNGSFGWQDTIKLKSNYTYSKQVKLTQPGYYKITFYNRQVVDFILYKSNIQVNADGNDARGFVEIKGSPEIDLIYKVQGILQSIERSPEIAKLNEEF